MEPYEQLYLGATARLVGFVPFRERTSGCSSKILLVLSRSYIGNEGGDANIRPIGQGCQPVDHQDS